MHLRFTIRDLLWLTLLAAVLVTWWLDRIRLITVYERRYNDTFGGHWTIELLGDNAKDLHPEFVRRGAPPFLQSK